jgi:hypothetical protein
MLPQKRLISHDPVSYHCLSSYFSHPPFRRYVGREAEEVSFRKPRTELGEVSGQLHVPVASWPAKKLTFPSDRRRRGLRCCIRHDEHTDGIMMDRRTDAADVMMNIY